MSTSRPYINTYEPDANGVEQLVYRMMNDAEYAQWQTDQAAGQANQTEFETQATNHDTLITKATTALQNNLTFLALTAPTQAQALTQVQVLTRQVNALIRLVAEALDSTDGT